MPSVLKNLLKTIPAGQVPFLKQPGSALKRLSKSNGLDKIFRKELKYLKFLIILFNLFGCRIYG